VLIPRFAQEGVGVVGIGPVARGRDEAAVGVVAIVVRALPQVLGEARDAAPAIQVVPVGLPLRPQREVATGLNYLYLI